jgi:ketosteroid isomerase-like protein
MDASHQTIDRFYRAVRQRDMRELREVLDPAVVVHVTAGLADGLGEARDQDREGWLRAVQMIVAILDLRAEPEEVLQLDANRFLALGYYRGRSRSGAAFEARFVHDFRLDDGRIVEEEQITDSARWRDVLGAVRIMR